MHNAGIIFLNQTPNPTPLRDSLGDLPAKLQRYDLVLRSAFFWNAASPSMGAPSSEDDMEMHAQKTYDIAGSCEMLCSCFGGVGAALVAVALRTQQVTGS